MAQKYEEPPAYQGPPQPPQAAYQTNPNMGYQQQPGPPLAQQAGYYPPPQQQGGYYPPQGQYPPQSSDRGGSGATGCLGFLEGISQ
ncbi:uncharacterized protein F4822DRAFT_431235 [Hypoxylon trugodes]|uniref:uncharacterized protein n=1 Tax=Hypoxylon trugodes TaxID=326681 RepID=UPI00219B8D44|nr:uncharacterized protein F4822DRAFT_431235 [Hypoxylon trugodes]KAI1386364.1 hypothetical protein F4822DRAFT_431235 [Hypoxylon trugodes]